MWFSYQVKNSFQSNIQQPQELELKWDTLGVYIIDKSNQQTYSQTQEMKTEDPLTAGTFDKIITSIEWLH